jgi:hypothetical protein
MLWRTNGPALAVGLVISVGALLSPSPVDPLSSGDTALVVTTVAELVALAGPVVAEAVATLSWKEARA